MPCYDHRNEYTYIHEHEIAPVKKERDKLRAMLCGILGALNSQKLLIPVLTIYNEKEAGVGQQEILDWWIEHQIRDRHFKVMKEAETNE